MQNQLSRYGTVGCDAVRHFRGNVAYHFHASPGYLAIVHPLVSRAQQSKARAKRILLGVWAAPCLLASPFLQPARAESDTLWSQYGSISRRSCLITLDPSFRRAYYASLFVLMYLLPLAFIGWTCGRIARCLLRGIALTRQGSLRRQEANRRKVAKMVMVVAAAFALSWTPYFLVSMWTQFGTKLPGKAKLLLHHAQHQPACVSSIRASTHSSTRP
ncbi:hypothetical protein MRX96_021692 [Rhipicephalus microplus]